jgi:molybdopterin molybdotransferase
MSSPDFPIGISLDDARERVLALGAARKLGVEAVPVDEALGRVLAADWIAPFDLPPFANSAMDGFALRSADMAGSQAVALRIVGTRFAGDGSPITFSAGECVRVTTGAPVPAGADAIALKENVRVDGATAYLCGPIAIGTHVRPAGEDIRRGEIAVQRGDVLTSGRLGALAAFGLRHVEVVRRLRAIVLTTGDELVEAGAEPAAGQIYNSNRHSLAALLAETGVELLRHQHLPDDVAALSAALLAAGSEADLVITSGGVSAGEADFLPRLLQDIGRVHFWKVRMRPGMPILVGEIGKALVGSLPGNPVSTMATFLALVRPAIDVMMGRPPRPRWYARLAQPTRKTHARAEYMRATLQSREDGMLWAEAFPRQGSGMLHGMVRADALALIPEEARDLPAGTVVEVLPLAGLV